MTVGMQKFSSRVAVFIGGVFTVAAYMITSFATDIRVFYFAQGALGGDLSVFAANLVMKFRRTFFVHEFDLVL